MKNINSHKVSYIAKENFREYRLNVRVVTELAWHGALHPPPAAPPGARGAGELRPRLHHPELPELQGRPGAARLPLPDRDRALLRAEAGPDRRHRLCRREQEVGLHHPQLPAARPGRVADALLGQPRAGRRRRRRRVLRPLGHRQDHPVGRPARG